MDFKSGMFSLKNKLHGAFQHNNIYTRALIQASLVTIVSLFIWFLGPLFSWNNDPLLANTHQRVLFVAIVVLAWVLKFLIVDIEIPSPREYKDPKIQKALLELQQRLAGFVKFLISTNVNSNGKPINLSQLPWYLLIGPSKSGKSTLLHQSDCNYLLRKQAHTTTKNIDWWVTRQSCLIDIPGQFLFTSAETKNTAWSQARQSTRWRYLLHLIRYWRGKQGINGIIIALPMAEIIHQRAEDYAHTLNQLSMRIHELQKILPHAVPCQLVITKCDLIPGFNEFFAEASEEDCENTWGISLPPLKAGDTHQAQFTRRYDALIKRLNDQLLWRLHHERDPLAKLALKDFPLNAEKLRHSILTFVTKINSSSHALSLDNIFLTSSLQTDYIATASLSDNKELVTTAEQALQIINEAKRPSRAFFIKKIVEQTIVDSTADVNAPSKHKRRLLQYSAIAASFAGFIAALLILNHDFTQSNNYMANLKLTITSHEAAIQASKTSTERLEQTLDLLNALHKASIQQAAIVNWSAFSTWYADDPNLQAKKLYQQALTNILIQELANYYDAYLKTPVNRDIEDVYTGLKTYVMLGNPSLIQPDFLYKQLSADLASSFTEDERSQLIQHLKRTLAMTWRPATLNNQRVAVARHYLDAMPPQKLAYIILKSVNDNAKEKEVNIGTSAATSVFKSQVVSNQVPAMFTSHEFLSVFSNEIPTASSEALTGNSVLGNFQHNVTASEVAALTQQVKTMYVSNYINIWESLLANIKLSDARDLTQISSDLNQLVSNHSPLMELLQTLHANTYFDPIASNSPKLYSLGTLIEKNQTSQRQLYQLFYGLSQLNQYIQYVQRSPDKNKAAFDLLSLRMKNPTGPNPITQLKLMAQDKPEPLKTWLETIADETLNLLMKQAGQYMDLSWRQQISPMYQSRIANRYPFNLSAVNEVDAASFTQFFGNPGTMLNFERNYLMPFIDTSKSEWHWKQLDGKPLPFSNDALLALQQAAHIHHIFFPNDDNKLYVQFTIQPYQVDDIFKKIKLSINDKEYVNDPTNATAPYTFAWPGNSQINRTLIQLSTADNMDQQAYPGVWGFFKLINQSYDSVISKKEILINLSKNKDSAKYAVFANGGSNNPLLSLNLNYFHVPDHIC